MHRFIRNEAVHDGLGPFNEIKPVKNDKFYYFSSDLFPMQCITLFGVDYIRFLSTV